MKIADLYVRVSTDEQADVGYSQRYQEEILRKYCEKEDIAIRHVIYEDHSAKTFNRPEWLKFLMNLRKHKRQIDYVLFTKWDRFSRNAGDAYQMINLLRKLGVEPQAIEQPLDMSIPENKMMLAFYLAAPEVENDRRALNVFYGMRRARKEGRWMGRAPAGFVNKITEDGKKYICSKEPEASIMKWAFDQILCGPFNINQLYLEATKKGLVVARSAFHRLLRNPVYCGRIPIAKHKDEEYYHVPGQHRGIISEAMWYQVQDILYGRKKVYSPKLKDNELMQLRGFLLCPYCGRPLYGSSSRGRKGDYYTYYHCKSPCKGRFGAEATNKAFLEELRKFVPKPGRAEAYKEIVNEVYRTNSQNHREEISRIKLQLEQNDTKLTKGRDLLLSGAIEADDFRQIKADCEKNALILETRLTNLSVKTTQITGQLERAISNLAKLDKTYEEATVRRKREILGSIFPEKLTFDGFHFRTARMNEVMRLIYLLDGGFSEDKTRKVGKKTDLSCLVARPGFEPRQTEPKSVVLPLYYRAIRSAKGVQK